MSFWDDLKKKLSDAGKKSINLWDLLIASAADSMARQKGRQKRRSKGRVGTFHRPGRALCGRLTPGSGCRAEAQRKRHDAAAMRRHFAVQP